MKKISQAMSLSLIAAAALALICAGPAFAQKQTRRVLHDAAMGNLRPARLPVPIFAPGNWPESKRVPFISPGTLVAAEQALKATSERGEGADLDSNDAGSVDLGQSPGTIGCSERTGSEDLDNKRVL
jgi:hypothetical protein